MFSNGSEFDAFLERNCACCALFRENAPPGKGCPVEEALGLCCITGEPKDFPYEWLDPTPGMDRYACRRKARKRADNIRGPQRREAYISNCSHPAKAHRLVNGQWVEISLDEIALSIGTKP